jgi:uncharacterized Fe-S cluster-containing radical SAM superfamily protein
VQELLGEQLKMKNVIDTAKSAEAFRRKGIQLAERQVLVTRFQGSEQEQDLTLPPNCGGWGRIHHFRRSQGSEWPTNPLPGEPAAHFLGEPVRDPVTAQVFQTAVCSWRCWYCFVDFQLLSGDPKRSGFKTAAQLLDLYMAEPDRPSIIDLSGGQPDLVPEWVLWFAEELRGRELHNSVYLWSDDNLSDDYMSRFFKPEEVERLASYRNYGRVGCFKGFDSRSFTFNTHADSSLFAGQFRVMRRLVEMGFDVYGYVTMTSDDDSNLTAKIKEFVDRIQTQVDPIFPLRTVPLRIREFSPTKSRMHSEHVRAIEIQQAAAQAWTEELNARFPERARNKRIFEQELGGRN